MKNEIKNNELLNLISKIQEISSTGNLILSIDEAYQLILDYNINKLKSVQEYLDYPYEDFIQEMKRREAILNLNNFLNLS
jgi:hypothetical protein